MRTFQLDSSIKAIIDGLEKDNSQVGVILGRNGVGQRDLVFALLEAPSDKELLRATGSGDKKQTKKGEATTRDVTLDAVQFADYALQVEELLPGGVDIVGIYLIGPAANASATKSMAQAINQYQKEKGSNKAGTSLLLSIDPSSKKCTAKCIEGTAGGGAKGGETPCDLKFLDLASHIRPLTCRHFVNVEVALREGGGTLGSQLAAHLDAEGRRVGTATASSGDALLLPNGSTVSSAFGDSARSGGDAQVQLLCSPACRQDDQGSARQASEEFHSPGQLLVHGCVVGRCLAYDYEPASAAVALLKADVARSLQARMDLLMAEAEEAPETSALLQAAGDGSQVVKLPRRAFFTVQVPWLQLSCYVFPGEGVEEVLSAAGSVLPLEVDPLQVQWAEQEASSPGKQQAADGDHSASGTQSTLGEGRPPIPFGLRSGQQALAIATIVCLVSCFVSYLFFSGAPADERL